MFQKSRKSNQTIEKVFNKIVFLVQKSEYVSKKNKSVKTNYKVFKKKHMFGLKKS